MPKVPISIMRGLIATPEGLSSSQTALLALIIGFGLGAVGLLALALMVWLSHRNVGVYYSDKHGISLRNASRLGGLAIIIFLATVWTLSALNRANMLELELIVPLSGLPHYFGPVLLIGIIGLAEDVGITISPHIRLFIIMAVSILFFLVEPGLLPVWVLEAVNVEGVWLLWGLSIICSVLVAGVVIAANVSDGANGLLSGLCLVFFWVAWQLTEDGWLFYLLVIVLCFWLINVITGRIMLGDLGAYGLGAILAHVAIILYDEHSVSLFFLASLLCYPFVELLRVIIVRGVRGKSPLSADNTHLHNLINAKLNAVLRGNTLPNSSTGLAIVIVSALPAILTFNLSLQGNTGINALIFIVQASIFLFLWVRLERC